MIAAHLHDWPNARYALDACNAAGCTGSNEIAATTGMLGAIGYFKASNTDPADEFGVSVAVSGDGNTIAMGASFEDSAASTIDGDEDSNAASASGAVYVYRMDGNGDWSQRSYVEASNAAANDFFGRSLSFNRSGNTLAVGASREDSASGGVNGIQSDDTAGDAGAAYLY